MSRHRIGSGIDVHAFSSDPARELVLGGVTVPGATGLEGHTDADVVLHAVADALLGALSLGDLGSRFGTSDPVLADAPSSDLLADVVADVVAAGWGIGNLDLTIVAQRPRLAPHQNAIRSELSRLLEVGPEQVSVKVTSSDRLGTIGRGEGIACWATCLLSAP